MIYQRLLRKFSVKRTALYDIHKANKGRMIQFAGYELPVLFEDEGVLKEHLHCRQKASVFDVSHMGQILLKGDDRVKFIERVSVGDIKKGRKGDIYQSYLSLFLNDKGGIIDDTIITSFQGKNEFKLVVNGANKHKVMEHFNKVKEAEKFNVDFKLDDSRSLICIQGPLAAQTVENVFQFPTAEIPFMSQFEFSNQTYQIPLYISRSGYTGQDGFQISFDNKYTNTIVKAFLEQPDVKLAGLGARDSLRVEAGLCLHGHDINESTTPFEATLMWTVSKKKQGRTPFIGQEALEKQVADNKAKKNKVQKRVGFMLQKAGVVRQGAIVSTKDGKQVGKVTSGTFSPILKKGIGMMYVDQDQTKEGTDLTAATKTWNYDIKVSKMPFIEVKYNRLWDKQA